MSNMMSPCQVGFVCVAAACDAIAAHPVLASSMTLSVSAVVMLPMAHLKRDMSGRLSACEQ